MTLITLGKLSLEPQPFTRIKPLILLAYLALEGVKDRRYIAEFFWPTASDNLNSLSRALSQLRKGAAGVIEADEHRVWATVQTDAHSFLAALDSKNYQAASQLYTGAFLQGAYLPDWGVELEEWIYEKREYLATQAQTALLELAQQHAARGRFSEAAKLAEQAYLLEGAAPPEPESLPRYFELLTAGANPLAGKIRSEAEGYGIDLRVKEREAQNRLQSAFLGRAAERQKLEPLPAGSFAWIRARVGMGKTELLKSLSGIYLPGRSGLPYATLEPLLGSSLTQGEDAMLRQLHQQAQRLLLDNWESMDAESQNLVQKLRQVGTQASVIISSTSNPIFDVELEIELSPISEAELKPYPNAWQHTGGLPVLVGAFLRGEALGAALEAKLHKLPDTSQEIYLVLALLDEPDPALVRRALQLDAKTMAGSFQQLLDSGLVESSGRVRAQQAARNFLKTQPLLKSDLSLQLARVLPELTAYPFFEQARLIWEDGDLPKIRESYLKWAQELLRRGFPQRSLEVLEHAPEGDEVMLLRARALERSGLFKEALQTLTQLQDSAQVLAFKGALLLRLGKPEEARATSEAALDGDMEARAEAFNTLGNISRSEGEFEASISHTRRAAAIWQSLQQQERLADALNNIAIGKVLLGAAAEDDFNAALAAAGNNLLSQARTLLNMGWMYEKRGDATQAAATWQNSAELAEKVNAKDTAATVWNNLAVLHHRQHKIAEARKAYERALELAQETGEQRLIGIFMANLAELDKNREAWEEALRILETTGYKDEAEQYRTDLPVNHPFKANGEQLNGH